MNRTTWMLQQAAIGKKRRTPHGLDGRTYIDGAEYQDEEVNDDA